MNRLATNVEKLKRYPSWVLSWSIGRFVKFTGTAGVRYEDVSCDRVVVSLPNAPRVRNHIGQIHAAAMALLAETATGIVVGMNVPDDKIPLIKYMNVRFVKRSRGAMRAEASLTAAQRELIATTPKGEVIVAVVVSDESGSQPIECEMCWAWIPKQP